MLATILIIVIIAVITGFVLVVQTARILRKTARTERKISKLTDELSREARATYRQMEDLLALYHQLSPVQALPGTRGWAASPDFLRVVMNQVEERRPNVILELGSGTSTIVAAYALKRSGNGHLFSLDHDPAFLRVTESTVQRHQLGDRVTVIHAPLVPSPVRNQPWYDLSALPDKRIDMLIIDGPPAATAPMARYPALPLLFDRLSADARIILDDSARDDEKACVASWLEEHPELEARSFECEKGCVVLTLRGPGT